MRKSFSSWKASIRELSCLQLPLMGQDLFRNPCWKASILYPSLVSLTFLRSLPQNVQGTPGTSRHPASYPYAPHGSQNGQFHAFSGTPQAQEAARYWCWGMSQSQGMHGQASPKLCAHDNHLYQSGVPDIRLFGGSRLPPMILHICHLSVQHAHCFFSRFCRSLLGVYLTMGRSLWKAETCLNPGLVPCTSYLGETERDMLSPELAD
jgi:hypothetical protein